MITVEIPKDQGIFVKIPLMAGQIRKNVDQAVHRLAIELQRYIVHNKLSGQVLNKRTGHLQQSIQQTVEEGPDQITGKVYSAGDVKYAAIHEYGGTIHHPGGTAYYFDQKQDKIVFLSNKSAASFNFPRTKAHDIVMPERSYMRTSLAENEDHIVKTLTEAATAGIKQP